MLLFLALCVKFELHAFLMSVAFSGCFSVCLHAGFSLAYIVSHLFENVA